MRRFTKAALSAAVLCCPQAVWAATVLSPTDFIIAIDPDPPNFAESEYPGGEPPAAAFDGDVTTKYLNFGKESSGVILTPTASSIIKSMVLTTANDAPPRDPASWKIWGTNDAITTLDNAEGPNAENWSLIAQGDVAMPEDRFTPAPFLAFPTNANSYSSYRITFPTLKVSGAANSMQIAEIGLFGSVDGTGTNIALTPTTALAILLEPNAQPASSSPDAEAVAMAIDGDVTTKYLNFGRENSGFIVTPAAPAKVVRSFQITTADDADARDPASWILFGTNDTITSANHSTGTAENWIQIDTGTVDLPLDRFTPGPIVGVSNSTAYASYKLQFPTIRDPAAGNADSMQIAEIQFFDTAVSSPADFDGDSDVDGADFLIWQRNVGVGTTQPMGDADGNNVVDGADLAIWKSSFGAGATIAVASIPEPHSAALVLLAATAVAAVRRRRK